MKYSPLRSGELFSPVIDMACMVGISSAVCGRAYCFRDAACATCFYRQGAGAYDAQHILRQLRIYPRITQRLTFWCFCTTLPTRIHLTPAAKSQQRVPAATRARRSGHRIASLKVGALGGLGAVVFAAVVESILTPVLVPPTPCSFFLHPIFLGIFGILYFLLTPSYRTESW